MATNRGSYDIRAFRALRRELRALNPRQIESLLEGWISRLEALPIGASGRLRASLLMDASALLYQYGRDLEKARDLIGAAVSLAEKVNKRRLLRRALSLEGLILSATRNTEAALGSLFRALELAEEMEDAYATSTTWGNLGIAFFDASLYSDARECFQKADFLARSVACPKRQSYLRSRSLHGSAVCSLHLRDFDNGMTECVASIEHVKHPADREAEQVRSLAETTLAHLCIALGQLGEAKAHLRIAKQSAARSGSARAGIAAGTVEALLEMHRGRTARALDLIASLATEAVDASGSTYRVMLKAAVEVYEMAGQPDSALGCLHKLMRLNEDSANQLMARERDRARTFPARRDTTARDAASTSKAIELGTVVQSRVNSLLNIAVTASLQSGHDPHRCFRLGRLARLFARTRGLDSKQEEDLGFAASLCDIGMVAIPASLLSRPAPIQSGEERIIEDHTRIGADLLSQARLALLRQGVEMARYHHERWDGKGPWRLSGNDIPKEVRIVTICDAFDALIHARPWRRPLSVDEALGRLRADAGMQFDPELVEDFVSFVLQIAAEHAPLDDFLVQGVHENWYVRARSKMPARSA
jgi:response regulator RpfG family c-di-GMP phosphodiesterase